MTKKRVAYLVVELANSLGGRIIDFSKVFPEIKVREKLFY